MTYNEDREFEYNNLDDCDILNGKGRLRQRISFCVDGGRVYPETFYYCEGFPKPKFKITVELIEDDFVIDKNGTRWIKDKSHEKEKV